MRDFLAGSDFVDRTTGFLIGWPFLGTLKSLCVAVVLVLSATRIMEHRDF
jgi:hypothetical protein